MSTYNIKPYTEDVAPTAESTSQKPFVIAIAPPHRDDAYCSFRTSHRLGGSSRGANSPDHVADLLENTIDSWMDRFENKTGDIKTKPTPDTVQFFIHPDFDGDISPSDAFGTATLGDFTSSDDNATDNNPWCVDQPAHKEYINSLLDAPAPSNEVLWVRYDKGTTIRQSWIGTNSEGELVQYSYSELGNGRSGPDPVDRTQLVRLLDNHTQYIRELLDHEWRDRGNSPFAQDFNYPFLDSESQYEVNNWEFNPDTPRRSDSWTSPDENTAVHVYGGHGRPGYVRVMDLRFNTNSEEYVPDGLPGDADDSELTLDEARATAIEWMGKTDPETWSHPYTNKEVLSYDVPNRYHTSGPVVKEDGYRISLKAKEPPEGYNGLSVRIAGDNVCGGTVGEHTITVHRTPESDGWVAPERIETTVEGTLSRALDQFTDRTMEVMTTGETDGTVTQETLVKKNTA